MGRREGKLRAEAGSKRLIKLGNNKEREREPRQLGGKKGSNGFL